MDRRRRKKLALKLAACALAGAVLTVVVAWSFSLWGPDNLVSRDGATSWYGQVPKDWPSGEVGGTLYEDPGHTATSRYLKQRVNGRGYSQVVWLSGWPALAMKAQERVVFIGKDRAERTVIGGLRVPASWTTRPQINPTLPLRPLWPGFALDTAFYGTLVFLLWSAPGVIRRRIRRRRGRCPACGYDLHGSPAGPCPECGSDPASPLRSSAPSETSEFLP